MEKLQPKLRFPEFDELWKINILGNLFDITAGGDIKKQYVNDKQTNEFKYPIYANAEKNKGLYGFSSIYKINEEVVTIAGRGVNIGIAHARKEKFYPIVRLLVLKPKFQFSVDFFEYVINNLNIVEESTGVPQLTAPQISKYRVNYPSLPEQQKIASFLTAVEDKISNLKQKISLLEKYKKGVMQQIFSQQIRFKDTSGNDYPEWEEKCLGDCLEYEQPTNYLVSSTEYSDTYKTPVLTAGKTFILGYTDEEFGVFNQFPVIIFDDFTTATQFVNFSFKAKSSAMKILKSKAKNDVKFLYELMQMINYEIGGHGRHWISVYSLLDVLVPCIEEQTKIAEFLTGIDEKIETTKLQFSKMEVWKKGLLQGMFC